MVMQVRYANSNHGSYNQLYVLKVTCTELGLSRCVKEAGTSDTFPQFVGHWYTDLKIMTVTAAILFAKYMYLFGVLFLK